MMALLLPAFTLGLLSSVHCVGMCGPIALAIPSARNSWPGRILDALLPNLGRTATYVLLGLLFGTFGRGLRIAGLQQGVSLALGLLIIAGLAWPRLVQGQVITGKLARWTSGLRQLMARSLGRTSPLGLWSTGMLNGLLPCGLVYLALAGALVQDSTLQGALFMLAFGMGTVPALFALRVGLANIGPAQRSFFRRLSPWMVAAMGVLLILRGAGMGIPYISPAMDGVMVSARACH